MLNDGRTSAMTFVSPPSARVFLLSGAKPARDSARLGLGASSDLDPATRLYLRYDGDVSMKDNSNMLTAGISLGL